MREILQRMLHTVWSLMPKRIRRMIVWLTQDSFRVTVAVVVVSPSGKVLLLHHIFRGKNGWGLPAGFVEHGENPEDAAVRELKEETGIEIDPGDLQLIAARELRGSIMEVGMAIDLSEESIPTENFEIDDARWFAVGALPADMSEESRSLIDLWVGRAE